MKLTKKIIKNLIIEAVLQNYPSIIDNGGQLLRLEDYLAILEQQNLPPNPSIYLNKLNGMQSPKFKTNDSSAIPALPEEDIKKLRYADGQKIFGKDLSQVLATWIRMNQNVIDIEYNKALKMVNPQEPQEKPKSRTKILSFLGLEEQRTRKLTNKIIKEMIIEELDLLQEIELDEEQLEHLLNNILLQEDIKKKLQPYLKKGLSAAAALAILLSPSKASLAPKATASEQPRISDSTAITSQINKEFSSQMEKTISSDVNTYLRGPEAKKEPKSNEAALLDAIVNSSDKITKRNFLSVLKRDGVFSSNEILNKAIAIPGDLNNVIQIISRSKPGDYFLEEIYSGDTRILEQKADNITWETLQIGIKDITRALKNAKFTITKFDLETGQGRFIINNKLVGFRIEPSADESGKIFVKFI